jgi:orotidine-5'-phosphate decarboxylase
MNKTKLVNEIKNKSSFLCIGLDTDITKIPKHLLDFEDPIFEFNKQVIDATHNLCVAYKPNTAFYEANGIAGWISLKKTIDYLNTNYPDLFTIADAKRGDIGNTSTMYAKAFFDEMNFDAITVAPYMGEDSIKPFLAFKDKWTIILALTSNSGAFDFQTLATANTSVFETVIHKTKAWGTNENTMYVVGATKAETLMEIRKIIPEHFLLVPGVGAQGGSLVDVAEYGMNKDCGLLVNVSRSIIYADSTEAYTERAREEASKLQNEMKQLLYAQHIA